MTDPYKDSLSVITDLTQLRLRHGSRRGQITRFDAYLTTKEAIELKNIRPSEVTRKKESLLELIKKHEAIQNRYEQIATKEDLDKEQSEVIMLYEKHEGYVERLFDLLQLVTAWKKGGQLQDAIEDLLEPSTLKSPPLEAAYLAAVQDFQQLCDTVRVFPEKLELTNLLRFIKPGMKRLKEKAARDLKPPDSSTPFHSIAITSAPPKSSRLKLELPKFSGDMLDWREFWNIFSPRLEREPDLEDYERINCLEDAMLDDKAKEIVRTHGYSGVYSDVVKALQGAYDRYKLVYKHHVQQVQSLPVISDDHASYTRLRRLTSKHLAGLHACEGDSFEQIMTALFKKCLPRSALALWSQSTSKECRPPTLKSFTDFLDQRIADTEMLPSSSQCFASDRRSSNSSSTQHTCKPKLKDKTHPKMFHLKETKSDICPACEEAHSIYQCSTFKELAPEKRYGLARRKHLVLIALDQITPLKTATAVIPAVNVVRNIIHFCITLRQLPTRILNLNL